jgi:hypothetical protein
MAAGGSAQTRPLFFKAYNSKRPEVQKIGQNRRFFGMGGSGGGWGGGDTAVQKMIIWLQYSKIAGFKDFKD